MPVDREFVPRSTYTFCNVFSFFIRFYIIPIIVSMRYNSRRNTEVVCCQEMSQVHVSVQTVFCFVHCYINRRFHLPMVANSSVFHSLSVFICSDSDTVDFQLESRLPQMGAVSSVPCRH